MARPEPIVTRACRSYPTPEVHKVAAKKSCHSGDEDPANMCVVSDDGAHTLVYRTLNNAHRSNPSAHNPEQHLPQVKYALGEEPRKPQNPSVCKAHFIKPHMQEETWCRCRYVLLHLSEGPTPVALEHLQNWQGAAQCWRNPVPGLRYDLPCAQYVLLLAVLALCLDSHCITGLCITAP